jgi:hypothetical protein
MPYNSSNATLFGLPLTGSAVECGIRYVLRVCACNKDLVNRYCLQFRWILFVAAEHVAILLLADKQAEATAVAMSGAGSHAVALQCGSAVECGIR